MVAVHEIRRADAIENRRPLALRALLLTLAAATPGVTGCSSFLAHGPPPKAQRAPGFTCTDSPMWPVVDIALSVLTLGETIHAAARNRTPWPWLGASVAFGASGGLGAGRVNDCNKAHGHPYVPRSPNAQPGMMPADPIGVRSTHPQKPPAPDEDDEPAAGPGDLGAPAAGPAPSPPPAP